MQTVETIVDAVKEHWILSGVEAQDATDMADELSDHLSTAVDDGKPLEEVVGSDLRAFANEWSSEVTGPETLGERVQLVAIALIAGAAVQVGMSALFELGGSTTIDVAVTGFWALLSALLAVIAVGPALSRLGPTTTLRSPLRASLTAGLAFGVIVTGLVAVTDDLASPWTITIPSWIGVLAVVFTLAIVALPLWALVEKVDEGNGMTKKIFRALSNLF